MLSGVGSMELFLERIKIVERFCLRAGIFLIKFLTLLLLLLVIYLFIHFTMDVASLPFRGSTCSLCYLREQRKYYEILTQVINFRRQEFIIEYCKLQTMLQCCQFLTIACALICSGCLSFSFAPFNRNICKLLQESIRNSADSVLLSAPDSLLVSLTKNPSGNEQSNAGALPSTPNRNRANVFGIDGLDLLKFTYKVSLLLIISVL